MRSKRSSRRRSNGEIHETSSSDARLLATAGAVYAAGADLGQAVKQATNWTAITMFAGFVVMTLFITKWAA